MNKKKWFLVRISELPLSYCKHTEYCTLVYSNTQAWGEARRMFQPILKCKFNVNVTLLNSK